MKISSPMARLCMYYVSIHAVELERCFVYSVAGSEYMYRVVVLV